MLCGHNIPRFVKNTSPITLSEGLQNGKDGVERVLQFGHEHEGSKGRHAMSPTVSTNEQLFVVTHTLHLTHGTWEPFMVVNIYEVDLVATRWHVRNGPSPSTMLKLKVDGMLRVRPKSGHVSPLPFKKCGALRVFKVEDGHSHLLLDVVKKGADTRLDKWLEFWCQLVVLDHGFGVVHDGPLNHGTCKVVSGWLKQRKDGLNQQLFECLICVFHKLDSKGLCLYVHKGAMDGICLTNKGNKLGDGCHVVGFVCVGRFEELLCFL